MLYYAEISSLWLTSFFFLALGVEENELLKLFLPFYELNILKLVQSLFMSVLKAWKIKIFQKNKKRLKLMTVLKELRSLTSRSKKKAPN